MHLALASLTVMVAGATQRAVAGVRAAPGGAVGLGNFMEIS